MHGHLNKRTPRKNTFYQRILRVHNQLNKKFLNISERIKHNYNYLQKVTQSRRNMLRDDDMIKMCSYYQTTVDSYLCSENKLESSNFGLDLPCCHQLFKRKEFPALPEIRFNYDDYNELNYESIYTPGDINHHRKGYDEKKYCVQTIKHFSKYTDEEDINCFVEEHMNENLNNFYIRNQRMSVILVIEKGIYHFMNEI